METKKFDELPFEQKVRILQGCALFPALILMVFVRRKLGFRIVKPTWLLIMAVIINVTAVLSPSETNTSRGIVFLFVVVMVAAGLFQRHLRWKEICRGVRWHTYSSGISYFEYLPLPRFLTANRMIYRLLDPALCWFIGSIIAHEISVVLGMWIILSGSAMSIYEQARYECQLDNDLNTLDGLVEAEMHSEVVKRFEKGGVPNDEIRLEDSAGIPTGVAPDIRCQIELRKAKLTEAPDNLA